MTKIFVLLHVYNKTASSCVSVLRAHRYTVLAEATEFYLLGAPIII